MTIPKIPLITVKPVSLDPSVWENTPQLSLLSKIRSDTDDWLNLPDDDGEANTRPGTSRNVNRLEDQLIPENREAFNCYECHKWFDECNAIETVYGYHCKACYNKLTLCEKCDIRFNRCDLDFIEFNDGRHDKTMLMCVLCTNELVQRGFDPYEPSDLDDDAEIL